MSADHSSKYFLDHDQLLLESAPPAKFNTLPDAAMVASAVAALTKTGWNVTVVKTKEEALAALIAFSSPEASYYAAGSTSLTEVGWTEWLKAHPEAFMRNFKEEVIKTYIAGDKLAAGRLAVEGASCDVFYSSIVAATTQTGEVLVSDATGSRVGGFLFAKKLVVVASTQKLVSTLSEAFERLEKFAVPLESARVRVVYGAPSTSVANSVVLSGPNPFAHRTDARNFVLVTDEVVGY